NDSARFAAEGSRRRILVCLADWSWRVRRRFHLGLWRFRRRRGPALLGRDPARASDRKSRTALTSSGSFRHWGVENLPRPSQCRVSSAKKRTARRFLIWFLVLMSPWNV